MKANKDLVENTKVALKMTLEKLIDLSDSYVDDLANRFPDKFQVSTEDRVIIPFGLIDDMNQLLNEKFDSFKEDETKKEKDPKYNN